MKVFSICFESRDYDLGIGLNSPRNEALYAFTQTILLQIRKKYI